VSEWDAVGGDPCPGDVTMIQARARDLQTVADHAADLHRQLDSVVSSIGSMRWTGDAADRTVARIRESVPDLDKFTDGHRDASAALTRWAGTLDDLQHQARALLTEYTTTVAEHGRAEAERASWEHSLSVAQGNARQLNLRILQVEGQQQLQGLTGASVTALDSELADLFRQKAVQDQYVDRARAERDGAKARQDRAEEDRRRLAARIDHLRSRHEDGQRAAATAILRAVGITPGPGGVLSTLWRGAQQFERAVVDDPWFAELLDFADTFGDILSYESTAFLVLAAASCLVAPEAAPVLLALSKVAVVSSKWVKGVTTVGHTLRAMNGVEAWDQTRGELEDLGITLGLAGAGRLLKTAGPSKGVLGALKRAFNYEEGQGKGIWSPRGIKLGSYRIPIHVTPKLVDIPADRAKVYLTLYALEKSGNELREDADAVYRAVTDPTPKNIVDAVGQVGGTVRDMAEKVVRVK
jgi:hypothetical protein